MSKGGQAIERRGGPDEADRRPRPFVGSRSAWRSGFDIEYGIVRSETLSDLIGLEAEIG